MTSVKSAFLHKSRIKVKFLKISLTVQSTTTTLFRKVQGDQLNMAVFFGNFVKVTCPCTLLRTCTLEKALFTRYQKNTAMFIWSPCRWIDWREFSWMMFGNDKCKSAFLHKTRIKSEILKNIFWKVTFYKIPEQHSHVYLVTLQMDREKGNLGYWWFGYDKCKEHHFT